MRKIMSKAVVFDGLTRVSGRTDKSGFIPPERHAEVRRAAKAIVAECLAESPLETEEYILEHNLHHMMVGDVLGRILATEAHSPGRDGHHPVGAHGHSHSQPTSALVPHLRHRREGRRTQAADNSTT